MCESSTNAVIARCCTSSVIHSRRVARACTFGRMVPESSLDFFFVACCVASYQPLAHIFPRRAQRSHQPPMAVSASMTSGGMPLVFAFLLCSAWCAPAAATDNLVCDSGDTSSTCTVNFAYDGLCTGTSPSPDGPCAGKSPAWDSLALAAPPTTTTNAPLVRFSLAANLLLFSRP